MKKLIKITDIHYVIVHDVDIVKSGDYIIDCDGKIMQVNQSTCAFFDEKITHSTENIGDSTDIKLISLDDVQQSIYDHINKNLSDKRLFGMEDLDSMFGAGYQTSKFKEAEYYEEREKWIKKLLPKIEWDIEFDEQNNLKFI